MAQVVLAGQRRQQGSWDHVCGMMSCWEPRVPGQDQIWGGFTACEEPRLSSIEPCGELQSGTWNSGDGPGSGGPVWGGGVRGAGAHAPHTWDCDHQLQVTVTSHMTDCPHMETGPKISKICDFQGARSWNLKKKKNLKSEYFDRATDRKA